DIAYGLNLSGNKVYFTLPTPGSANNEGVPGTRDNILVSVERGFYSAAIQVVVNVDVPHDTIMYTTDGSEPTLTHGTSYTTPINISTTTPLRVAAFKGDLGFHHGVISHSYIYLTDVIRQPASIPGYPIDDYEVGGANLPHDHEMDPVIVDSATYAPQMMTAMTSIPTMSIQVDPDDIYGESGFYDSGVANGFVDTEKIEKKASVEILYFDQIGDNHQANAGIEAHSKKRLKRSLRLNFRSIYGDAKFKSDLLSKGPLNGDSAAGSYDKLIIRAGNNRTWARHHGGYASEKVTQTVDEFFRATQVDASGYGSRGTFVHLYINGIYWGLYNPVERPDSKFSASYFGGDSDDWFAGNHKLIDEREADPRPLSGDITRYNYLINTLIYKDMTVDTNYAEFQEYLNPSYFIDYLLLSWWGGIQNWPYNNLYFGNRSVSSPLGPTPLYFTRWDSEFSFDQTFDFPNPGGRAKVHLDFTSNRSVTSDVNIVAKMWHSARRNDEFMQLFTERVNLLTSSGGALNDTVARARWATLNDFVSDAIVAESARWGDALISLGKPRRTRDIDWQREVDNIDGLLEGNVGQLLNELRDEGYYP
ncbi:MAG: chitobiase/beta-hexosaminidase C-terminal domain-containing protein, partial [Thiotrichaceae bacterium]